MKPLGRRAMSRQASTGTLWLAIRSRKKTPTFWEVTRTKISEVAQLPPGAWPVLSLDEEDIRLAVEKPCSNKQSRSFIRRKSGQVARIINASSDGVIYGRSVTSTPLDYDLAPASMLIDQMLMEKGWPGEPFVVGFLLSVPDSHNEILALWAGNVKRDLSSVEVTENAQQVEQIIEAFCAKHSISSESEANLLVVDLDAVLNAVASHGTKLRPYPSYDDIFGIPVQTVWGSVAACSGIAAIAATGAAAALLLHGRILDDAYGETLAKTAASREVVVDLFKRNLATVAARASVDYRTLASKAETVYAPGGLAAVYADGAGSKVRYSLPIDRANAAGGDVLTIETTPYRFFKAARARTIDGITPTVSLGGAGNELFFDYPIAATNRRLLDYLDR